MDAVCDLRCFFGPPFGRMCTTSWADPQVWADSLGWADPQGGPRGLGTHRVGWTHRVGRTHRVGDPQVGWTHRVGRTHRVGDPQVGWTHRVGRTHSFLPQSKTKQSRSLNWASVGSTPDPCPVTQTINTGSCERDMPRFVWSGPTEQDKLRQTFDKLLCSQKGHDPTVLELN